MGLLPFLPQKTMVRQARLKGAQCEPAAEETRHTDQSPEGSCEPGTHSRMQNPNSYPRGTERLAREYLGSALGFPQIL